MFATIVLTGEQITIIVLAAFVAAGLASFFFRKNEWLIFKRRRIRKIAERLNDWSMPFLGDFFQYISDGDVASAFKEGEYLERQLADDKSARAMLGSVGKKQLPKLLNDQSDRIDVLQIVNQYAVAHPDEVKAAGFSITTTK